MCNTILYDLAIDKINNKANIFIRSQIEKRSNINLFDSNYYSTIVAIIVSSVNRVACHVQYTPAFILTLSR